jgi:hypothetical protein
LITARITAPRDLHEPVVREPVQLAVDGAHRQHEEPAAAPADEIDQLAPARRTLRCRREQEHVDVLAVADVHDPETPARRGGV